jgi:sec-independent protein translocase protein TatB
VFGIGPQELMILALLFLVVFGPRKASSMARDLGHFVKEARRPVEELKSELAAAGEHWNEPTESASDLHSGNGEDAARNRATKSAGYLRKGGATPQDVRVPNE